MGNNWERITVRREKSDLALGSWPTNTNELETELSRTYHRVCRSGRNWASHLQTSNYQASRSTWNIPLRPRKSKTNTWIWFKETMNIHLRISSKRPDRNVEVNDRTVLFRHKCNHFIAEVLLAKIPPFSYQCIAFRVTTATVTYSYEISQINGTRKASVRLRICRCLYCEISHLEVNGANERQIAHVLVKMVRRRL